MTIMENVSVIGVALGVMLATLWWFIVEYIRVSRHKKQLVDEMLRLIQNSTQIEIKDDVAELISTKPDNRAVRYYSSPEYKQEKEFIEAEKAKRRPKYGRNSQ